MFLWQSYNICRPWIKLATSQFYHKGSFKLIFWQELYDTRQNGLFLIYRNVDNHPGDKLRNNTKALRPCQRKVNFLCRRFCKVNTKNKGANKDITRRNQEKVKVIASA